MKNLVISVLRKLYVVYVGIANHVVTHIPFNSVRCFLYRHVYRMKIGKGTQIEMGVRLRKPRGIRIGENTNVHLGCLLDGRAGMTIGNNVDIGDEVLLFAGGHDVHSPDYRGIRSPIVIDDYACVFARTVFTRGVHIGEGGVVGVCSLVTKDVEPYTIVAGVPARKIGERARNLAYSLNPKFRDQTW